MMNKSGDQEGGPSGEKSRGCATNLHDRQAFPLGNAFLLSRFSGLDGNSQSNSRFAPEQGPHLGNWPSHFWETGEPGAFRGLDGDYHARLSVYCLGGRHEVRDGGTEREGED